MKKRVVVLAFAAMAAGLAGMGVWCARLNARVHELEEVKSKSEKVKRVVVLILFMIFPLAP